MSDNPIPIMARKPSSEVQNTARTEPWKHFMRTLYLSLRRPGITAAEVHFQGNPEQTSAVFTQFIDNLLSAQNKWITISYGSVRTCSVLNWQKQKLQRSYNYSSAINTSVNSPLKHLRRLHRDLNNTANLSIVSVVGNQNGSNNYSHKKAAVFTRSHFLRR